MENRIENAYNYLEKATKEAYNAGENSINKKEEYDQGVAKAYANGEVQGKNQAERDGWIAEHFQWFKELMLSAQERERGAKLNLELARIEVEKTRALLRLMELTK
jgi:nucleoside 2-deoxyribosyltransferase